jgi:putative restriction endonuclease
LTVSLDDYAAKFKRLNVAKERGRPRPHKVCMLLAVLDLALAGGLRENRILFAPPLLERYRRFFHGVRSATDHPNPYFPFFHLKSPLRDRTPSFWHLAPLPGRERLAQTLRSARCNADITANFGYAYLDDELFRLLQDPACVRSLIAGLSAYWFDRGLGDLQAVADRTTRISAYEYRLRTGVRALAVAEETPPAYVRDPAFRRVVTEVYDYRCAATGQRVLLPSGEAMVEAAHIHPFCEAGDDDPRNGIALTPDMHWAMDRNLIAPGPDYRWYVSPLLDRRVPDNSPFCGLEGKTLLLPSEGRMYPKREALEWRMERLRDPDWRPVDSSDPDSPSLPVR